MGFLEELPHIVLLYFLPFARISSFVAALPLFGSKFVPFRIKAIISLALTILILFSKEYNFYHKTDLTLALFLVLLINQIIMGILFGLVVHIIFQGFVVAGQMIAMQMGLGFASLIDPQEGVSVPAISQFYVVVVTLLYFSMNGHLFIISALMESFHVFPVDKIAWRIDQFNEIALLGGLLFLYGTKIALPAVIALFISNISFGLMMRSSPQLNVFTIGFSITMILGFVLIWMSFSFLIPKFNGFSWQVYSGLKDFVKS